MTSLIVQVRVKRTLAALDQDLVRVEIMNYLRQHPSARKKISNPKSAASKELVAAVRARFHDIYEVFQTRSLAQRDTLLAELDPHDLEGHRALLATHLSSKERLSLYSTLYAKIFAITGTPQSILDLSCGLNPLSFPFMSLPKKIRYTATEFSEDDVNFVRRYFQKIGLSHAHTLKLNLITDLDRLCTLPRADLCFIFKVLDVTETQKRHHTYQILAAVPSDTLVVSFSLQNVKGEAMRRERVHWFERVCRRLAYSYDLLEEPGELFYLVRKK